MVDLKLTAEDPGALAVGRHVIADRYEVLGLIGVGGMGAVYKVRDLTLDEMVALKVLRPELAVSPDMLARFRREVKLARRVTHRNVARVFDLCETGPHPFLTMELVEGESLEAILSRGRRLELARIAELLQPVCAGLSAAHAASVVHRDLKPDNLIVASDGRVVITDFGIARLEASSHRARTTAIPLGTPAYMAPEQVEGAHDIDFRADLYALGVMLFEMLTGRLPWEAASIYGVAAARLMQPPPDPRTFASMPEPVALLVQQCMARDREDRPASAQEIATRFAGFTLPATPASAPRVDRTTLVAPQPTPGGKTVAVLPFRNTGAPEDDYLVDGLTDDLVDALSMTPGLRVRPEGVVQQAAKASADPLEVGRALAVQAMVTGTANATGDVLQVTARALSVMDGFQLWAQRFQGRRADVLRIADDVGRAIATALTVRTPTRNIVTDARALNLYLRGRHEYVKFWSIANDRAVKLLGDAHELAPEDPLIMAAYASALARQFGLTEVEGRQELARRVAERAVEVAPELAEAHLALATVYLHETKSAAAAAEVRRAEDLAPSHPDALELHARLLDEAGDHPAAIDQARRCMLLEPRLASLRYNVIARGRALLGEWDEVEREMTGVPDDPQVASLYWLMLVRLALWRRDVEGAKRIAEVVREMPPFGAQGLVLSACVIMTTKTLLSREMDFLKSRAAAPHATPRIRSFWHQLTAELLSYSGDAEGALTEVEAADRLGLFDLGWLDRCPLLGAIRDDARFQSVQVRVAERAAAVLAALV